MPIPANEQLGESIETADLDGVRSAIRAGADVTGRSASGASFLYLAALCEDPEILDAVLVNGHQQATLDEALTGIVTLHREPQVRALLEHGANPNAQVDASNVTCRPIWQCAFAQESLPEVLRLLLDHGADPSVQAEWGGLPVDCATPELQEVFMERGILPDSGRPTPPRTTG